MMRRFSLLWKRFTPLEERLLAETRKVLPVDALSIFDAQVDAIKDAQRAPPSWSEILFYPRQSRWAGVPKFPCTDEFRLAEVRFRVGTGPTMGEDF